MCDCNISSEEETNTLKKCDKEKISKIKAIKNQLDKMNATLKDLENSLGESEQNDKQLVTALRMDNIKNQRLASQLEDARKENKQLLNTLQQQYNENDLSRSSSRSQIDTISACSTVSMVHLQYKYEELMASHDNLLKMLESRVKEVQNAYGENNVLRDEIENLNFKLSGYERKTKEFCQRFSEIKKKKDEKISRLRNERNTLKLAHDKLSDLLTKQCMEQDKFLVNELHKSKDPVKSLLLSEIRKTNKLQHENSRLKQEILGLRAKLEFGN